VNPPSDSASEGVVEDSVDVEGASAGHPRLSLLQLSLRFLRFGFLAWGGPVAQIAMLRHSLVDTEGWVSPGRFNRTLAVYQALPGPEAQELAVYFGTLARGRIGGLLAGLGFMLPGLILMLALSWIYTEVGTDAPAVTAAFAGCQAAVVALVLRGVHRIANRTLSTRVLVAVAVLGAVASLVGVHFALVLAAGGLTSVVATRSQVAAWIVLLAASLAIVIALAFASPTGTAGPEGGPPAQSSVATSQLLGTGLKAGLLTFGGAYTAIPFVRGDAVGPAGWMSDGEFLDGLALAGVIPAPLVIFGTFVGYVGGGLVGGLALTLGMFLPAFAFTLLGHSYLEAMVGDRRFHAAFDGIAAAVVGLAATTLIQLAASAISSLPAALIFGLAAVVLYAWRATWGVAVVIFAAAALGIVLLR
jgi:chromate transporter